MPVRLSVVVATDTWANVRVLAGALAQQTAASELELELHKHEYLRGSR